ncbi:MAG: HD domain-containing protein [Minisyncoccia bacterium]
MRDNPRPRPPGRELFLAPFALLDPADFERIRYAYIVSKHGHAQQTRDDGSRYFDHPKSATWIYTYELNGRDPDVAITILLHDIEENADLMSPYRIALNFGKEIALYVVALTKLPRGKETTEKYLGRIVAAGPIAILAKLCDRLHNLRTLYGCTEQKRSDQLEETMAFHLPILIPALREHGEPWRSYANIIEEKIHEAMAEWRPDGKPVS